MHPEPTPPVPLKGEPRSITPIILNLDYRYSENSFAVRSKFPL